MVKGSSVGDAKNVRFFCSSFHETVFVPRFNDVITFRPNQQVTGKGSNKVTFKRVIITYVKEGLTHNLSAHTSKTPCKTEAKHVSPDFLL
jgi:hypothetical protein